VALKRYDEARAVLEDALRLGNKVWGVQHPQYGLLLHTRGELAAATGDLTAADAHLRHALDLYGQQKYAVYRPLANYELAQVSARLGRQDAALRFLEQALELGYQPDASAPTFVDDPQLASLRAHPRFKALASATPGPGGTRP
jgi:tetratricopeptide (TPR) repeat protein